MKDTDICTVYHSKLFRCAAYATYMMVFVAFASMQYFALLMSLIFYFILVLCRVIASPSCLHHSLMFVLFCFALLCSVCPSPPPPSASCLGYLYLGPFVFSAVPVPPPPGVNIEEHIQIRQEEKRQRINRRHRLEEGRGMDQG